MATKDRRKLQHIHSSIADKQPTPQSLEVGEIAVNNSAGKEFLSLKNSNDKVVRFSSDSTLIDWIERKEVMPYSGCVRGGGGPEGAVDPYYSYGIQESDLINNTSEIIIKLNQVAADNTAYNDNVNGAVDKYNNEINPISANTDHSDAIDGAGFFIDMSRYAMQGANPTFSGITNTCYSNLNGTTRIKGTDGACGSLLDITINSAKTDVETANTEITSANTVINTATTVVTVSNTTATTATLSGTSLTINENNINIQSCGQIHEKTDNFKLEGCTTGGTAEVDEKNIIVSGDTFNITENNINIQSCTKISGKTNNFTIEECSDNGSATIKESNTIISGDTLIINEGDNISAITPTTVISGTDLTINENNTTINSCGKVEITSNNFKFGQCSGEGGKIDFDFCGGFSAHSDHVTFEQCTTGEFTVKENTNTISGGTLTTNTTGDTTITASGNICETATNTAAFKGTAKTNIGKDCSDGGQTTILNLNGTTINETGTTVNISAGANICESASTEADFYAPKTQIGVSCGGSVATATTVEGTTVNVSGNTTNITGVSNTNIYGGDICISGGSEASLGAATVKVGKDCGDNVIANNVTVNANTAITVNAPTNNISGATTNISGTSNVSMIGGDVCISANTEASMGAKAVRIGTDCGGSTIASGITAISTNNITLSSSTVNISGTTTISGNTTIGGTLDVPKGLTKKLSFSTGTTVAHGRVYNGSADTSVTVASDVQHLFRNNLKFQTGDTTTGITYDPGSGAANTSRTGTTVNLPSDAKHIHRNTLTFSYGAPDTAVTSYDPGNGTVNTTRSTTVKIPKSPGDLGMKNLNFNTGATNVSQSPYNGSAEKTITIPSKISNLTNDLKALSITYASSCSKTNVTYNGSSEATIYIPKTLEHVSCGHVKDTVPEGANGEIQIDRNVVVTGKVSATQGFFQTSDERMKKFISPIDNDDFNKSANVFLRSFSMNDDETNRKMYGVIAQEVESAGLEEIVHTDENGYKTVDYTSLLILKLGYLDRMCSYLNGRIVELEEKLKNKE